MSVPSKDEVGILVGRVHLRAACKPANASFQFSGKSLMYIVKTRQGYILGVSEWQ